MRSVWKAFYNQLDLSTNLNNQDSIITFERSSIILPFLLNKTLRIYNGKKLINLVITENMFYHKIGEFAHTRAVFQFKKKKKKKKNKWVNDQV